MIKQILAVFIWVLFFACSGNQVKFNKNNVEIYGHGGSGLNLLNSMPMNSKKSIAKAITDGAIGIEVDIQITKDGYAVLYHEDKLDNQTNCSGLVAGSTINDILNCKYNGFIQQLYGNAQPLFLLDSLFAYLNTLNPKPKLILDLKIYPPEEAQQNYYQQFAIALINQMEGKYPVELINIESTSVKMLKFIKTIKSDLSLFIYVAKFMDGFNYAKKLNLTGITIRENLISLEQVKVAHNNGLLIAVWRVKNDKKHISALQKEVDIIETDNVKSLVSLLK